jgi:hypothetical protein
VIRTVVAVAARPGLWPTAVRQVRRLAPARWWRRWPFLPVPDRSYLEFRILTQYGDARHRPDAHDVLDYLSWCKRWDHGR